MTSAYCDRSMRFTSLFSIWFLLCACLHVLGVSKWKHLLSAISEWEALEFAARKSCLEKVCIMVPPERIKYIIIVQHLTRRPSVIRMTNRRSESKIRLGPRDRMCKNNWNRFLQAGPAVTSPSGRKQTSFRLFSRLSVKITSSFLCLI